MMKEKKEVVRKQLSKRYVFLEEISKSFKREIEMKKPRGKVLDSLFKKLYFFATKDHLTGVFNRLYLDEMLSRELEKAKRKGYAISIFMLDIDNFKKYNDGFGHLQGDEALRKVTTVIKSKMRKDDFIARYGGEEFLVVLPNTNTKKALEVAERVRIAVSNAKIKKIVKGIKEKDKKEKKDYEKVTISIGISQLTKKGIKDMINRADVALYKAKAKGKNKICISKNAPN